MQGCVGDNRSLHDLLFATSTYNVSRLFPANGTLFLLVMKEYAVDVVLNVIRL